MRYAEFARAALRRAGVDVIRWPQRPDDSLIGWTISSLIEKRGVNCVLDVGANTGQFGQLLRSIGYRGRIVSFEPSPNSFQALRRRAAGDADWHVKQLGLAAKPGSAELHIHGDSVFDSLHSALGQAELPDVLDGIPEYADKGTVTVTLSTLAAEFPDAVAGLTRPCVLLKSDTQGHDLDVIAGAEGLSPQVIAVLVELSVQPIYTDQPYMTRVIDRLKEEKFIPIAFQPVTRSLDELRVVEFDGLFMRQY